MKSIAAFHFSFWALLLLLLGAIALGLFLWRWRQGKPQPLFYFSDTSAFFSGGRSWRQRLAPWPQRLGIIALSLFAVAFCDPHLLLDPGEDMEGKDQEEAYFDDEEERFEEVSLPSEGIAIYLALDESGSMAQEVNYTAEDGSQARLPRMEVLKRVTAQFIKGNKERGLPGRRDDLIGLVAFARVANILSPLTLDHRHILTELSGLNFVTRREADGTAMGYAIFKTTNLIAATRYFSQHLKGEGRPAYEIKSNVIVLVTDGFHYPSPLDKGHPLRNMGLLEAAQHAKKNDVRLYIVDIEPAITRPEFRQNLLVLKQAAEVTGGRFFLAGLSKSLADVYREIDQLERSHLPVERRLMATISEESREKIHAKKFRRVSFYPTLVGFGLLSLLLAVALNSWVVRRVP